MNDTFKKLLLEELECKKVFEAKWATECDCCGEPIDEGEEFYFMGDKKKVCNNCMGEAISELE